MQAISAAEPNTSGPSPLEQLRKVSQYVAGYENWLECLRLRRAVGVPREETRVVRFRSGLRMNVRVGTPDISILWEVLLGGAYASTERLIREAGGRACCVIDLGANIGAYTLRCALVPGDVEVHSYEPGPQNAALLRANLALNAGAGARVRFHEEAVAQTTGTAVWRFDAANPGGSSLLCGDGNGDGLSVRTVSFRDVLGRCGKRPIALVKIDIEGSEYGLLDGTEASDWETIPAVLTELHPDPAGRSTPDAWLRRMADLGFKNQQQEYSSVLLRR